MELIVSQKLERVSEPIAEGFNTSEGLLNSYYKSVVNRNFESTISPSLFGKRQGLKNFQFNAINHTAVILKLSVFAMVLVALF